MITSLITKSKSYMSGFSNARPSKPRQVLLIAEKCSMAPGVTEDIFNQF